MAAQFYGLKHGYFGFDRIHFLMLRK